MQQKTPVMVFACIAIGFAALSLLRPARSIAPLFAAMTLTYIGVGLIFPRPRRRACVPFHRILTRMAWRFCRRSCRSLPA